MNIHYGYSVNRPEFMALIHIEPEPKPPVISLIKNGAISIGKGIIIGIMLIGMGLLAAREPNAFVNGMVNGFVMTTIMTRR